jgi:hypothetical protein
MSIQDSSAKRVAIFLPPGEGRTYPMGRISAVFKADGDKEGIPSPSGGWSRTRRALARTPTRKTTFFM